MKIHFDKLNDFPSFDAAKGPCLLQPFILLRTQSDVTRVGETPELHEVMVPVWLQAFEREPKGEELLNLLVNSRAAQHQNLQDWNALPVLRRDNFCYHQPAIIGLKQQLEFGIPDTDNDGIEYFCQPIRLGVRIGIWAHSRKAAQEFVDNPRLP